MKWMTVCGNVRKLSCIGVLRVIVATRHMTVEMGSCIQPVLYLEIPMPEWWVISTFDPEGVYEITKLFFNCYQGLIEPL